jgi:hypothetical protein
MIFVETSQCRHRTKAHFYILHYSACSTYQSMLNSHILYSIFSFLKEYFRASEERTRWERELAEAEVGNFRFNHCFAHDYLFSLKNTILHKISKS